jgi:NTP pyrophosphatase (non-canonical NTP hydrolase)
MDFDEFQRLAQETDLHPKDTDSGEASIAMLVPLLGLAGEVGELLSEYKKRLRDGESYSLFKERIAEELGDLLWYVSNVATKFDLSLDDVARGNLEKTGRRWSQEPAGQLFDEAFPPGEQLPRVMEVELRVGPDGKSYMYYEGVQLGDALTDNRYEADGYRYHDIFHLTYMAMLGWSPIIRGLLNRKRRSDQDVDEVEDGARAAILEECIAALAFSQAERESFFRGVPTVRYEILRAIKAMTNHLEVGVKTEGDWQRAILRGFEVWNQISQQNGGRVRLDLVNQTIEILES